MKGVWLAVMFAACGPSFAHNSDPARSGPAPTEVAATTSVGMVGGPIERILPGTELEVAPIKDAPIVVRILDSYKHGDSYRYVLTYYGLEAGTYDLSDYVQRKDGSTAEDLPPIPVVVESVLPAGQIEPAELEPGELPRVGGYRMILILAGIVWFVVLLALLFVRRRRRADDVSRSQSKRSLAEQIRPLVESAVAGKSTPAELAALEHALMVYWRRRLGVERLSPAAAIAALKDDPAAAKLLMQLENWLHRPGPPAPVDIAELLRPYRDLSPEPDSFPPADGGQGTGGYGDGRASAPLVKETAR